MSDNLGRTFTCPGVMHVGERSFAGICFGYPDYPILHLPLHAPKKSGGQEVDTPKDKEENNMISALLGPAHSVERSTNMVLLIVVTLVLAMVVVMTRYSEALTFLMTFSRWVTPSLFLGRVVDK